jgi:hypothetical protein
MLPATAASTTATQSKLLQQPVLGRPLRAVRLAHQTRRGVGGALPPLALALRQGVDHQSVPRLALLLLLLAQRTQPLAALCALALQLNLAPLIQ